MILKGITQKGKNRIRENGEKWDLLHTADTVLFDTRPGPWGFVQPRRNQENARWIHLSQDTDFEIVSI